MPRPAFNFSLGSLLLAALSLSALLGGILTLDRDGALYRKQQEMTVDQLDDLAGLIRGYMDRTEKKNYPETLSELIAGEPLLQNFSARYYINPRLAEMDNAFFTLAGVTRKDVGCIWLYENVPPEMHDSGRFVLIVQGEALVPTWMSNELFQLELKKTLSRPGTKALPNARQSNVSAKIPELTVFENRFVFYAGTAREKTFFLNVRRGEAALSVTLFFIAVLASFALFINQERLNRSPAK